MSENIFPPNALRVKLSTSSKTNEKIFRQTEETISRYANSTSEEISSRIRELDKEWDTERILEANASIIILASIALGLLLSTWWFFVTGIVAFYLLQHAVQGWCPPLPILRKLGVRTMVEISAEKTALKIFRGDFENTKSDPSRVLKAVNIS